MAIDGVPMRMTNNRSRPTQLSRLVRLHFRSHNSSHLGEQELLETALALNIERIQRFRRVDDLITEILKKQAELKGDRFGVGLLEIIEDGFGFLRGHRYLPSAEDIYVSQSQIRRFGLRTGDIVGGVIRPPKDSEKYHSLLRVESINSGDPEETRRRPRFDTLTPIFPHERIDLETNGDTIATRIVDIVAPVGRGQRGSDRFAA